MNDISFEITNTTTCNYDVMQALLSNKNVLQEYLYRGIESAGNNIRSTRLKIENTVNEVPGMATDLFLDDFWYLFIKPTEWANMFKDIDIGDFVLEKMQAEFDISRAEILEYYIQNFED